MSGNSFDPLGYHTTTEAMIALGDAFKYTGQGVLSTVACAGQSLQDLIKDAQTCHPQLCHAVSVVASAALSAGASALFGSYVHSSF